MNRRELLNGLGIAALAATVAPLTQAADDVHHHHGAAHAALIAAALRCMDLGESCVAHCNTVLATGDGSLAYCQTTAMDTVAICAALHRLAQTNSPHLAKVAAAARDICLTCEEECRKHAAKHDACKACGEACADCAKQCAALAA